MPAYAPTAFPAADDIERIFALTHGRAPVRAEIELLLARPMKESITAHFHSPAFYALRAAAIRRDPAQLEFWSAPIDGALVNWAATFFPLAASARDTARGTANRAQLFEVLYRDWRFRKRIAREWRGLAMRAFIAGLRAMQRPRVQLVGAVEAWSETEVTGWVVDRYDPTRPLCLELRVDGRFVAAARTGLRAHPEGGQWGGDGLSGFRIGLAARALGSANGFAEVREVTSGFVVGRFETKGLEQPPLDAIAQIRDEIGRLRNMLDRIESKLPDFNAALGYSLESYDAYFYAYYEPVHRALTAGATTVDMTVVIDATGETAGALEQSLASVARQNAWPRTIHVVFDEGDLRLDLEAVISASERTFAGRTSCVRHFVAPGAPGRPIERAIGAATGCFILLMPAGIALAPDALTTFAETMIAGAAIAYSDSDCITVGAVERKPRHSAPVLRSGFDHSLILQQDMCGPVLAVRRDLPGLHPGDGAEHAFTYERVLASAAVGIPITHIPRILYHVYERVREPDAAARQAVVSAHLATHAPGATVNLLDDQLGAATAGALRVRWPVPRDARAAIIIPTRDRLDLLVPCLASIESSVGSNRIALEVVIVNNRSQSSETQEFLARAARFSHVSVLEHDGAFNWATMNNRAAAEVSADVLIFLNNDTVTLSPDCWDELCGQALRPSIGAVGARLLYEDGTVQHAGVVMDEWHSFASHEGVGDAANYPGYCGRNILTREVSSVTGACLATRAELFHKVGGFDGAAFPVEGNDSDYCLRLRSLGYKILYDGQACLYHFESRSRGYNDDEVKQRRADLATRILRKRWAAKFEQDPYYNPHFDRLAAPFRRLQPPRPLTTHAA